MPKTKYTLVVPVDRATVSRETQQELVAATNRVESDLQQRQSSQRMGRSRHIRTGIALRRLSPAAGRR